MPEQRSVVIAKSESGKGYYVIDPLYGVCILFSAVKRGECRQFCQERGYRIMNWKVTY